MERENSMSNLTQGQAAFWIVFAAVVGAVIVIAIVLFIHTTQETKDPTKPRMTVREFIRGIRF
jgi:hypothetical protein